MRTHQDLLDAISGTPPQGIEEPPPRLRRVTAALTELARIARLLREIVVIVTTPRLRAAVALLAVAGIAAMAGLGEIAERVGSEVIHAFADDPAIGRPTVVSGQGAEAGGQPPPCLPTLTPLPVSRRP